MKGSDAKAAQQAILYTAHYDHLGIHADEPGDNIYNGAADNATGCGILLELARVFAAADEKPTANDVFLPRLRRKSRACWDQSIWGSIRPFRRRIFHSTLNYDDIQPLGDPQQLVVSGAERTSVYPLVEKVASDFAHGHPAGRSS